MQAISDNVYSLHRLDFLHKSPTRECPSIALTGKFTGYDFHVR
jgi:hypothetical protein